MRKYSHYFLIIGVIGIFILISFPFIPLSKENGVITLNREVTIPFKTDKKVLLIYFGYVGCRDVCPASLNQIKMIYHSLDDKYKKYVGLYFIDIINSNRADDYAKIFDEHLNGIDLSSQKLMKFMNEFDAYKSDSLTKGGDIYHTSYLYIVKKENNKWILKKLFYTNPYKKELVLKNIKKFIEN